MISVEVLPAVVILGVTTATTLRISNTGSVACVNVLVEFEPPRRLILVRGNRLIELNRLRAGEHYDHAIQLRGTAPGTYLIDLVNFSYRQVSGEVHRNGASALEVLVRAAPARPALPPAGLATAARASPTAPPSVFVSYRRDGGSWFVRNFEKSLRRYLHPTRVFVDDAIRSGEQWRKRLDAELEHCSALLALIGPGWERWNDEDILAWEVARALRRNVLVIPILFDEAKVPNAATLPVEIRELSDRQAKRIDREHFESDVWKIAFQIERSLRAGR